MLIQEAYNKFLEKVNRNSTNDDISADYGRFVIIFNEEQNRFVEWILERRSDDDIRYIRQLLVKSKKLDRVSTNDNSVVFTLPKDYFDYGDISITCEKGSCKVSDFFAREVKAENVSVLLSDTYNKPDFLARETFLHLGTDGVYVYRDGFNVTDCLLTYYRYPRQVDMAGRIRVDGTYGEDIHPEFDDKVVDRIITASASRFFLNNDRNDKASANDAEVYRKM